MTPRMIAVPAFTLLMAICAQATVPMTPVPMTLQTFAVLLAGAVLGARWGAVSVLLYLALAASGLPVLSEGASGLDSLLGPTAGYLFAFPVAAAVVGALISRPAFRGPAAQFGLMAAAHLLILTVGASWLATPIGVQPAFEAGFLPFLIGALVKSALVVLCTAALTRLPVFRPA